MDGWQLAINTVTVVAVWYFFGPYWGVGSHCGNACVRRAGGLGEGDERTHC